MERLISYSRDDFDWRAQEAWIKGMKSWWEGEEARFPMDTLPLTPRSWADRSYNLQAFKVMEKGGHFLAMEEPELFSDDVRDAFSELL